MIQFFSLAWYCYSAMVHSMQDSKCTAPHRIYWILDIYVDCNPFFLGYRFHVYNLIKLRLLLNVYIYFFVHSSFFIFSGKQNRSPKLYKSLKRYLFIFISFIWEREKYHWQKRAKKPLKCCCEIKYDFLSFLYRCLILFAFFLFNRVLESLNICTLNLSEGQRTINMNKIK